MSLALKVLVALVAGLAVGLAVATSGSTALAHAVPWVEPVGTLWVAAIRMTIIPLVVASLVVGVGGAPDPRTVGRLGVRSLLTFVAMCAVAAVLAALVAPPVLALVHIDPAAAAAMRSSAASAAGSAIEGAKTLPGVAQWIVDLVPVNPVKAAADGAMLPLIVFTLAFGIALTRVAPDRRSTVMRLAEAVQDASLVLVGAVLALAPVGVFALAVGVGSRLGATAVGALALYVALICTLSVVYCVAVAYPAAVVLGGVPLRTFARALLPTQAVAFSSRSSLAALPAMFEAAGGRLGFPPAVSSFVIPLAMAVFRTGAVMGQSVGAYFVARLYGVDLGAAQFAVIGLTGLVTSFSVPGIPGGAIIMMVPVLMAAGIPVEGVGLLLGVDTIPDMFRTTVNVTSQMAATAIVAQRGAAAAPAGVAAAA